MRLPYLGTKKGEKFYSCHAGGGVSKREVILGEVSSKKKLSLLELQGDENLIFFCCIRRLLLKTVVVEADDVVGCWSF